MNTKTIVAIVVGAIASFLLGWLVWGILLMNYFKANTNPLIYEGGLMIDPPILWAIFISNLVGSTLLAWMFINMKVNTLMEGMQKGAILYFLIGFSYDMMFYSMMNWYNNSMVILVDILVNAAFGGIIGGIIAMILGRGSQRQQAAA